MKKAPSNHHSEHQKVSLLLPWYVLNTLDINEQICVDNHLKYCLLCRRELVTLQKLSKVFSYSNELTPIEYTAFAKLKTRIQTIDQQSIAKNQIISQFIQFLQTFRIKKLTGSPPIALASALIICLIISLPYFISHQRTLGNNFNTLTSSTKENTKENEIRVVFSNDITQNQIAQILSPFNAQIVSGPTLHGVFRVRVNKENFSTKEILKMVTFLRKSTNVIFAEPAISLLYRANQRPG